MSLFVFLGTVVVPDVLFPHRVVLCSVSTALGGVCVCVSQAVDCSMFCFHSPTLAVLGGAQTGEPTVESKPV